MNDLFTKHANQRSKERGIRTELVELILSNSDVDFGVGGNCNVLRISQREAQAFARDIGQPEIAKRLSSLAVIDSGSSGRVVSVLRDRHGQVGRRYRRPMRGRNARYRIRRRPRKSSAGL